MSKPTFVFVPGASHLPQVYDGVRARLSAHDYDSIAVPLSSVGGKPPTEDFTKDIVAIRDAVSALVEHEKDIVVVLHSYNRLPGGQALESLEKNGREANGLKGQCCEAGLRHGCCSAGRVPGRAERRYLVPGSLHGVRSRGRIAMISPAAARMVFYNDLPDDVAAHWLSILQPQSLGVFWIKASHAAWRYIPTTYVLCEKDQTFGPAITDLTDQCELRQRKSPRCMRLT